MTHSDLISLLALIVSGVALFSSLRVRKEERHLLILEQRTAAVARLRATKNRMEESAANLEAVLALPLSDATLRADSRQALVDLAGDLRGQMEVLDISERALLTNGHAIGRATHAHAVSIKNVLHNIDVTVQSAEYLLGGCAKLLEFSKNLSERKQQPRRFG